MIAIGRAQFPNGIPAIRNLLKHNGAIRIGSSLLHLGAFAIKQAKNRARKRFAVLPDFLERHPVYLVPNHGIAVHLSIGGNGECLDGGVQRVPGRRIGFLECVGAGHDGNVGNLAVCIGVFAVDDVALRVVDLDERAGQFFCAGDIRLGEGHRRVNQAVENRLIQIHGDDVFTARLMVRRQRDGVRLRTQQPAVRHGQLLDVVISMRIQPGEREIALAVGCAGGHQGVRGQLLAVAIRDHVTVEQAKDKAFARNRLHSLTNHAVRGFSQQQVFLLLAQGNTHRQIGIAGGHLDLDQRGLLIHSGQREGMRCGIQHVAIRRRNFREGILAQWQNPGFDRAGLAGGERFNQLILAVEHRAFLAHDVLGCAQFKHSPCQVAVLKHRAHDGVAIGVLLILKAHQLQARLFEQHIAAYRRIGDVQRDRCCVADGHSTRCHGQHQNGDQPKKENRAQARKDKPFGEAGHGRPPLI